MNKLEGKSKEAITRMNMMVDSAYDRGNEEILLRMLYAVLKACGETDYPKDSFFSLFRETEEVDVEDLDW
jgi:hypothetical protein